MNKVKRAIIMVAGYLKEQFACLEKEYDGLRLIKNPYYESCNNISSLYVAREHLEDVMILDGDQVICNADVMSPWYDRSGYKCRMNRAIYDGVVDDS